MKVKPVVLRAPEFDSSLQDFGVVRQATDHDNPDFVGEEQGIEVAEVQTLLRSFQYFQGLLSRVDRDIFQLHIRPGLHQSDTEEGNHA